MLQYDGEYPVNHKKYFIEKPILLNIVNWSTILCPRLYWTTSKNNKRNNIDNLINSDNNSNNNNSNNNNRNNNNNNNN